MVMLAGWHLNLAPASGGRRRGMKVDPAEVPTLRPWLLIKWECPPI